MPVRQPKLLEHLLGMAFVTAVLLGALFIVTAVSKPSRGEGQGAAGRFGDLSFVDFNSPFGRALLKDAINIYYPGRYDANDSLYNAVVRNEQKAVVDRLQRAYLREGLSAARLAGLLVMYGKFLLIYLLVMVLTYYGVQTLGVFRFVYRKRRSAYLPDTLGRKARRLLTELAGGFFTMLLFCPAYVIAYSIRTEFNTDTVVFMVLLGTVSNGVLITYANKFYAFLVAESRRGYVDTAIVKNLHAGYRFHARDGVSFSSILRPVKRFKGHVFDHIYKNARYQYLSTIKEQASFLITGLIIIEMALNIHGHLNYEMLRQLLYKNYPIVTVIILGIFYTVKMTEIFTDAMMHRESLKYDNRSA